MTQFASIEAALEELRLGRMVILVDDERREQEGDLVIAADKVTPEAINFMTQYARGLVCLTLTEDIVQRLQIPLMPERYKLPNQAAFTVSIEAVQGVTTGVSVFDRTHTIRVAIDPASTYRDISMPGHVFPLQARKGGVLARPGHTEGSVDLARLAGMQPAAVICEIMKDDGTMARLPDLQQFAEKHHIKIVSINDLISYRFQHEKIIEEVARATLPLKYSDDFSIRVFQNKYDGTEHIALVHNHIDLSKPILTRIHSECLTGDTFGSLRCDCGEQLHSAIQQIAAEKGILLYMRQEGRGIGLSNKIRAYQLQSEGLDTVDANHRLGFLADHRHYGMSAQILQHLGIKEIRLLTNNPRKIQDIESFGIKVTERVKHEMLPTEKNTQYLKAKRDKLGHLIGDL
jgi:3,4-dihydroxy 2-butanone 4-phosphate synthase/GTP cyclohydrolase II